MSTISNLSHAESAETDMDVNLFANEDKLVQSDDRIFYSFDKPNMLISSDNDGNSSDDNDENDEFSSEISHTHEPVDVEINNGKNNYFNESSESQQSVSSIDLTYNRFNDEKLKLFNKILECNMNILECNKMIMRNAFK
jgi:hypothetical protein